MEDDTLCLFCREKIIPYNDTRSPEDGGEGEVTWRVGPIFSKLCEYLEIIVDSDWCQRYKDLPLFTGNLSDDHDDSRSEVGVKVKLLCLNCFELVDNLRRLYQDLEKIQREIEQSKRDIKRLIITASWKTATQLLTNSRKKKLLRPRRKSSGVTETEFVEAFQKLVKESQDSEVALSADRGSNLGARKSDDVVSKPVVHQSRKIKKTEIRRNEKNSREDDNIISLKLEPIEDAIVKIEVEQLEGVDVGQDGMLLSENEDFDSEETNCHEGNDVSKEGATEGPVKTENAHSNTSRKSKRKISQTKNACVASKEKKVPLKLKLKRTLAGVGEKNESASSSSSKYTCGYCQAKFRFAHQYYTHRKSHPRLVTKPLDIRNVYGMENGKRIIVGKICSICDLKVKGRGNKMYSFIEHMLSHENTTPPHSTVYECDQCDRKFNIELNLDLHRKYNHEWQNIHLKCEFCENTSRSQAEFALHLKSHDDVTRVHSCKNCPMVCTSLDKLLDHMVKHSRSKQLYCPECPQCVLPSIKELYLHCDAAHPELKEKSKCSDCDKTFLLPSTLRTHLRIFHGTDVTKEEEGEYFCSQCNNGKIYKFKRILDTHVQRYHSSHAQRFKCEKCDAHFAFNSLLQKHIQEKHEKVRYPCPHCPKLFADQVHWGNHIKTHTGEGLLPCPVCEKRSFPSKSQLRRHLLVHEKKDSENSFVCETCGKGFHNEHTLRRHKNIHIEKKLECPHCHVFLRRPEHLRTHLRTHTGERPYVCHLQSCKKAFNRRDILIVHMRSHGMSHEEAKEFCKQQLD